MQNVRGRRTKSTPNIGLNIPDIWDIPLANSRPERPRACFSVSEVDASHEERIEPQSMVQYGPSASRLEYDGTDVRSATGNGVDAPAPDIGA